MTFRNNTCSAPAVATKERFGKAPIQEPSRTKKYPDYFGGSQD